MPGSSLDVAPTRGKQGQHKRRVSSMFFMVASGLKSEDSTTATNLRAFLFFLGVPGFVRGLISAHARVPRLRSLEKFVITGYLYACIAQRIVRA